MDELRTQAIAELSGIIESGDDTPNSVEAPRTTETPVAGNNAVISDAQEDIWDSFTEAATTEEATNDDTLNKVQEELERKEKELKKKYLSQVNKKDKELKELQVQLEELKKGKPIEDLETIEKIVQSKILEAERIRIDEKEKNSLFRSNPDLETYRNSIEQIKKEYPTMSWEAAKRFYFSLNDEVIQPWPSNKNLNWNISERVIAPKETKEDLYNMAKQELEQFYL
jgi:exonuclease VII large subunit